ncbi:MAG: thioesterase family protein [Bacteroidales bacterium]|jgi:acyl-CoA thioester hydrolase|nr:thioesterase family protein [Bacteroidales bacterium]
MFTYETKLRVRYGETDKMGYVYYGNYPLYYEVGRTELMRSLGFSYKTIEEMGIMLPVRSLEVKYYKPAVYDDHLTIKTIIKELPKARITFYYQIFNENEELLNQGLTTLVFVDESTRKPRRAPLELIEQLRPHFKD